MDTTIDNLQLKINESKALLSKESREAIDAVNWKYTIQEFSNKYTKEQIENLTTETELLLCGLIGTEDYPIELSNRLQISKEEVNLLINELDRLIFKKIQAELEKRINKTVNIVPENKPSVLDPRFISMPKDIQDAISRSDWKNKIYEISKKYKINIEQMGILEDLTVRVIQNTINPNKFESEINSKITISRDDMSNLIKEINDNILLKIREGMKNKEIIVEEEKVPIPPYAKIEPKKIDTASDLGTLKQSENVIGGIEFSPLKRDELKDAWPVKKVETIPDVTIFNEPKIETEEKVKSVLMDDWSLKTPEPKENSTTVTNTINNFSEKNIMDDKLKSVTMSDHSVSDYSTPKITSPSSQEDKISNPSIKSHDPYREAF